MSTNAQQDSKNNDHIHSESDEELLSQLNETRSEIKELNEKLMAEKKKANVFLSLYEDSDASNKKLQKELSTVCFEHQQVVNSTAWKLTKPLRAVGVLIKRLFSKIPGMRKLYSLIISIRTSGVRQTYRQIAYRFSRKHRAKNAKKSLKYTKAQIQNQREYVFDYRPLISIVVPLFNTPYQFLSELVDSVKAQTYDHWELCFADGSDNLSEKTAKYLQIAQESEPRIKYKKLDKNLGISGNTNAAIELSTGEYIALLDHDDLLHPSALFEVVKVINEQNADFIYTDEVTFSKKTSHAFNHHFKPDFSPDLLRSYNYICHLTVFSKKLTEVTGLFRSECDGSQDYDMILRLTEQAKKIVHIPRILYFWRASATSTANDVAAKPYTMTAAKKALADHLQRLGLKGTVSDAKIPTTYRIRYQLNGTPLVSILIPNMDHIDILDRCIQSIEKKSTYTNYEIIIIENNSRKDTTFEYYDFITGKYDNIRVIRWEGIFNYSAINNFAFQEAKGEYYVLLNNDIEIITPQWIEEMLMYVQRDDVGAAGALLYYPDDTVQHAGVILGIGGIAGHSHKHYRRGDPGYMSRLTLVQDLSAVTAACMMVKASVIREVNGLDEKLQVAFNDVDLCMKIRQKGYLIVFTPYAEAYHHESKSRGQENTPEKVKRFNGEVQYFHDKWGYFEDHPDPYYNPNLTLDYEDFSFA